MENSSTHIPKRMNISFQIDIKPNPFSITFLTMIKYHLEGTMLDNHCIGSVIFSMGNIKPVSNNVGSIMPIKEAVMAACCVFALMDNNSPIDKDVKINKVLANVNNKILPRTRRSKKTELKMSIMKRFTIEIRKLGVNFAIMIYNGLNGDTNNTSMVPNSFSFTMATDVIMVHTSINTKAITPGTKLGAPRNSGLYNICTSGTICKGSRLMLKCIL